MQCPTCNNDLAFLAVSCPHCGQPSFGAFIGLSIFTPEEEARQREMMLRGLGYLVILLVVFGLLAGTALAVVWGISTVAESPLVSGTIDRSLVALKWLFYTALAFLPFGVVSGLVTRSCQNDFLEGYAWGQLTGPIGFIVVIFQIPDNPRGRGGRPRATVERPRQEVRPSQARRRVFKDLFGFTCTGCQKRYKVDKSAVGTTFQCVRCGISNRVTMRRENSLLSNTESQSPM